ncbi:hypothetical protein MAPG_01666 [Magnaporthiopsis poae ATCC 64411]|uniref:CorA family metal ion transporter n=1 Tax=Magnaporthiopsis poae (strain ATCC 64411 / 73-15) TaxID=644358 RepID=A0A0C4DPA6_MAGP6|nr:hypothetical protein MAPG_01666 [Magnaporthiopsis poae ATCC 64411]
MSGPAMATDSPGPSSPGEPSPFPRPSVPPDSTAAAITPPGSGTAATPQSLQVPGHPVAGSATTITATEEPWSGGTGISWANGSWTTLHKSDVTVDRIIKNARLPVPGTAAFQHEGGRLDVFFLATVKTLSTDDVVPGTGESLKKCISDMYAIPEFFWSHAGYEANGFFTASQPDESSGHPKSCHASISRFLMKQMAPSNNTKGHPYHWHYLAFATYWYPSQEGTVQVVLCFDLPRMNGGTREKYGVELIKAFKAPDATRWRTCPFAVYSTIASVVTRNFDDALWTFQGHVRKFEKLRVGQQPQAMDDRFIKMHDLSRHVIHTTETLQVTARTLASIRNHHSRCRKAHEAEAGRSSADDNASNNNAMHGQECNENEGIPEMLFYQEFIENLRLRAGAFNERVGNEILLSFHLSSADDNITAKQILQDGRNDGRELTQLVSTATLLFLPGTFVSGFFGMNFFGTDGLGDWRRIWIFFVVAVPLTVGAFLTRHFYQKRVRGKKEELLRAGDVEGGPGIRSGLRRLSNKFGQGAQQKRRKRQLA